MKQTIGRNRKEAEEICRPEGEGEKHGSEREDGRPCIKWRKLRTTNSNEEERKTEENANKDEEGEPEDEIREKEEGQYGIKEKKVTEEGNGGQGTPKQNIEEIKKIEEGEKKTKQD